METVQPVAVIIGIVKGVSLGYPKLTSLQAFILSLVTGIVLGYLQYFGLTIEAGILAALTGSGVYQVAKKVGGS